MKNCVFTELSVVSFQERAARRIMLDRQTNVFLGANDTGKSSLLKCMYWAFGAEPSVTHPRWERAEVAVMLRFEIEGEPYQILRQRDQFVLLDRSDKIIARERRVTTGIGPRIAELFDFGLVATDREGEEFIPPPAFLFLPFYIDQEASWKSNWSGFRKLEQVRGYRKAVAEYHVGIRPNSYYKAKGELDRSEIELKRLVTAREVVLEAKRSADEHLPYQGFDIDPVAFAQDIDELLQAVNELATKERSYQASIQELQAERHTILMQSKVVQNELGQVKADSGYVSDMKHLGPVECPTCGAVHENNFLDRFEIARDVDRCEDLLRQLEQDLVDVDAKLGKKESEYRSATERREQLEAALDKAHGGVTFQDVIASEGRKQVHAVFRQQVEGYTSGIGVADARIASLRRALRSLTSAERRDTILASYRDRMSRYLEALNVDTLPRQDYEDVAARIRETGSDLPRALLAYYYSVLHTMQRYGSSVYCPIIIDSPNQQGQDRDNLPAMLRFIFGNRPEDSQLMVACEDLHGIQPDGTIIEFGQRLSALTRNQYEEVSGAVRPVFAEAFGLEAL